MKYYAANNYCALDVSLGFANTWEVLVFDSRKHRDQYVDNGNMSTRAIKKTEITSYTNNLNLAQGMEAGPRPFSGEYWGIVDQYFTENLPAGYIGHVQVCEPYSNEPRLYP